MSRKAGGEAILSRGTKTLRNSIGVSSLFEWNDGSIPVPASVCCGMYNAAQRWLNVCFSNMVRITI